MGMDAFRFSIAWSRIFPSKYKLDKVLKNWGKVRLLTYALKFPLSIVLDGTGSPNAEAIAHYNKVIDLLLENGIYSQFLSGNLPSFLVHLSSKPSPSVPTFADIEPHVTLWVEDHPQALEERYGGLLSPLFM
jgi:beta-glucosidase/6-phospho-beta-glucosidase/beta-galactosidase